MSQLRECRQQLDRVVAEKSSMEADVARLSEELNEAALRLRTFKVLYLHLVSFHSVL